MSESRLIQPDAGWVLSLYPTAGEAGGCFVPSWRPPRAWVPAGFAADPARARLEAARRAKKKVRVYCAANRLNRLGTLTYAGEGCHDPAQLRLDVAEFFRSLRAELGRSFPYVWVPEWHKTGHGLHVHFAVGQFIARGRIQSAWGRGFVHIKRLSDLPMASTTWHESRRAAGYLSKYVTKAFEPSEREHLLGLHRYEVGQGFQPPVLRLAGRSSSEALSKAVTVMGGSPSQSWSSTDAEGWKAPPAVWFAWD
jgi:hypothetical protein